MSWILNRIALVLLVVAGFCLQVQAMSCTKAFENAANHFELKPTIHNPEMDAKIKATGDLPGFVRAEGVGEGAQGFVVRLFFENRPPILTKQFSKKPKDPLVATILSMLPEMSQLQAGFFRAMNEIAWAADLPTFKFSKVVGTGLFGKSIEFADLKGRDLDSLVRDDKLSPELRIKMLNEYNSNVENMVITLREKYGEQAVTFESMDRIEPGFNAVFDYTHFLKGAPTVYTFFIAITTPKGEKFVMVSKPDNVLVTPDKLEQYVIDMF